MLRLILAIMVIILSSCASVPQPAANLGDETKNPKVTAFTTHFDVFGIGTSADQNAQDYKALVEKAFENSPADTKSLKNVKVLRNQNFAFAAPGWLLLTAGTGSALTGTYINNVGNGGDLGGQLLIGGIIGGVVGLVMVGINLYDNVLIAEPSKE